MSRPRPSEETLHGLFAVRARRDPGRPAVSLRDARWTYGELADRSSRLARRLRRLGVGPESRVGLAMDRSPEMVAGILGVLEAGAAYVPLDPNYPEERQAFMWADCQSGVSGADGDRRPVLLTRRDLAGRLPTEGSEVVLLDRLEEDCAPGEQDAEARSTAGPTPEGLAYVMYTSGSTGRPKGVLIAHRGAVNVIRENIRLLEVGPQSRVLQLASLSFDASVLEIFTALGAGAELVLTPRETLLSGEALGEELRARRITTLAIPPSLLDKIPESSSAAAGERELPDLASIVVGGETCTAATASRWAPGRLFFNAYAPTEATIYITAHPCHGPFDEGPPIGEAIAGGTVRVLDPDLEPVPEGESGELCLGGVGVARGYHGRAALSAERFVPDPFSEEPGARLYRSGDLGRRRPDGALEFLGRADHQVKVRGVRIELGEIESVLADHPGVQSAVVELRASGAAAPDGERRLVGYFVPAPGHEPTVPDLRGFLADRLPEAMVPQAFVRLDALPMAPTGKVDRKALPDPGRERPELETEYRPPRTPVEETLCGLWEEILGLERVGVHDDLFELGGHSLIVTRIAARVREDMDRELPLLTVFERPTVAELAEWLDAAAGGEGPEAVPELPPIERVPREPPPPASLPQERVWFLLQLAPQAIAYNFQFTVRFRGGLEVRKLERALTEIVRRHEVLRTTFPAVEGRPVQRVHAPFPVRLPRIDLTALPAARRAPEAHRWVRRKIRRGFDVTRLPLFRPEVFVLGSDDHLFLQVEHHFIHDGWSLAVYLREMQELYRAYVLDQPSPLPELPIQYADFAAWQRDWLDGEAYERQLAYWREQLAGPLPELELPTDRPRPPAYSFRGGAHRVDMPPELYAAARRFGRGQGMTLFMTMLAAFYALLHRITGQEDMLLGSGLANRRHRETEDLVGMVVNTVVLRARPRSVESFRDLLEAVRSMTLEAHLHQDMPFERLVQVLQPERDLSRNPLFQVLFSFHDAAVPDLELPDLGIDGELYEWHNGSAKSDLNVVVKPLAEQRVGRTPTGGELLTMVWEYSEDILDSTTVERMWGHYQVLLRGAIEEPERPLGELPVLTRAEEAQLAEWNDTGIPSAAGAGAGEPVHLRVARRAREHPEAPAVAGPEGGLSYGELVERAEALAGRLRRLPGWSGPETIVALLTGRSPETAVAALGVLAAGGAYLPVDPEYPAERISTMLASSGAAAVIARRDLAGVLPDGGPEVLDPAEPSAGGAAPIPAARWHRADPVSLAYVIYTSGSTGEPKGVEVPHGGLANLVDWHCRSYGVERGDRATLLAGPGFDAAVWELWPHLVAGAALHTPTEAVRTDPEKLLGWLAETGATISFLATPLAEAVLDTIRDHGPPAGLALRAVLTGGDRLHRPPEDGLPFRLVNHYGPTESTVVTTAGAVDPDAPVPPPIGRPIEGLRVRLLDAGLRRVPVGVPGELCVGGRGLARGYRGRPGWTAEAFVPDAFDPDGSGGRLYRTGDLARYRPDGSIDFLGRIDTQVQIRGLRVELGEIEAVLAEHPSVREAVVLAEPPGEGGDVRLVGFFVAGGGGGSEADRGALSRSLIEHLEARLPASMVPRVLVPLESIPLTPNGKVDRRVLADRSAEVEDEIAPESVAPRGPLEERIAVIWGDVLGCERVGVHDDFFALGGHSLLGTRLLARIHEECGVEIPLPELFDAPTVAGLAAVAEALLPDGAAVPGPGRRSAEAPEPIPRRPAGEPAPLAFAQERLWFLDHLIPESAAYVIARGYRVRGALDVAGLARALSALVARHESLRTRFVGEEESPEQLTEPGGRVELPVIDLSGLPQGAGGREGDRLARAHAARPFDLETGPVLRSALLRTDPSGAEHHWLLALHHIVADGGSMEVFHREVEVLYDACRGGGSAEDAELPELPVQYPDFALWQRRRLRGEVLDRLLGYWRDHLEGAPALLELPTDRPRPAVQAFRGARASLELPPDLVERLDRLARSNDTTRFMLLLAAFSTLLARWAGRTDVVVGTPVAGRVRPELEPLIGLFVNTLPLRLDLAEASGFRDLLAEVRRVVLEGHEHEEMPFEKVVEELRPERNLSHSPVFQVLFTLQEGSPSGPVLPGLDVSPLPLEREEARFDLELAVSGDGSDGLQARLQYDRDLFDRETADRLLGCLRTLTASAVEEPERAWEALPLLTDDQRRQVLEAGGAPSLPEPAPPAGGEAGGAGLHHAVLEQVERTPDAEAVVFAAGSADGAGAGNGRAGRMSYGELGERSGRLADLLSELGVGQETPVAVFLERGPDLMVTLLAILRAGGAYVPLDPDYPERRIALILEDTAAPVVVTRDGLADRLPAGKPSGPGEAAARIVRLDADAEAIAARDATSTGPAPVAPESLAYVIYTSGSTGRPKGVAISHGSARALLAWARESFSPEELAGVFAATSICFDLSVFELFVPLAAGGRVILADSVLDLPEHPAAGEITLINTVPSAMAEVLALTEDGGWPESVETVNLAGEPLRPDLVDRLVARGVTRVHDLYGPSEDTTYSTWARRRAGGPEVIGRPVAGTRAHVLDPRLGPVPPGVPGELVLGGAGLARGYLWRPAETAERFVPDPFGPEPGARLYRTGDLARRPEDGELRFLGRIDSQVKVRGFRVELGEIEAALTALPEVREAAALASTGTDGEAGHPEDLRLVAYAVPADGEGAGRNGGDPDGERVDGEALGEALRRRLPRYMVPSPIGLLDELPRLPNGKVDRGALRALGTPHGTAAEYVAPEGETEEAVARIWEEVLGVERVGAGDDFFALGGHSLLATRVIARIRRRLEAELPLRVLFQRPTVRSLARAVEEAGRTPGKSARPGIQRVRRRRRVRPGGD